MKLCKRDRRVLESILRDLERGQAYLMADSTVLCRKASFASTTLHFTNQQGAICYSVDKEIGSELALLHTGIHRLRRLLDPEELS